MIQDTFVIPSMQFREFQSRRRSVATVKSADATLRARIHCSLIPTFRYKASASAPAWLQSARTPARNSHQSMSTRWR